MLAATALGLLALLLDAGQRLALQLRRAPRPGRSGCAAARRPARSPPAGARARVAMRHRHAACAAADRRARSSAGRAGPAICCARQRRRCPCRAARRRRRARRPGRTGVFSSPKRSVSVAPHRAAARALGQQRDLQAADRRSVCVRASMLAGVASKASTAAAAGCGLKSFTTAATSTRAGAGARSGCVGRQVDADGAVVAPQVLRRRRAARRRASPRARGRAARKNSRQSPCAIDSDSATPTALGVGEATAPSPSATWPSRAPTSSAVIGSRGERLVDRDQRVARLVDVLARRQLRRRRSATPGRPAPRRSANVLDASCCSIRRLCSRPDGASPSTSASSFDRGEIGVGAGRHVVAGDDQRRAADAAQRDAALAVLRRVERVERRQLARRLRDRAEALRDPARAPAPASNLPATIRIALSGW